MKGKIMTAIFNKRLCTRKPQATIKNITIDKLKNKNL